MEVENEGNEKKYDGLYLPLHEIIESVKILYSNLMNNKEYNKFIPENVKEFVKDDILQKLLEMEKDIKIENLNEIYCSPPQHVLEFVKVKNNFLDNNLTLTKT